jgi:hypothetical protein
LGSLLYGTWSTVPSTPSRKSADSNSASNTDLKDASSLITALFDDWLVKLTEAELTLRIYWFPVGASKVIPLGSIKSVTVCRSRSILEVRDWGLSGLSPDAQVWWHYDIK